MNKSKCPTCGSIRTIKYGCRKGVVIAIMDMLGLGIYGYEYREGTSGNIGELGVKFPDVPEFLLPPFRYLNSAISMSEVRLFAS